MKKSKDILISEKLYSIYSGDILSEDLSTKSTTLLVVAGGYLLLIALSILSLGGVGELDEKLSKKISLLVGKEFDVRVFDEETPNAFTLALGIPTIYITKGLLKMLNEREVIAVLLHETKHVMSLDTFQMIISKLVLAGLIPKHFYKIFDMSIKLAEIHPALAFVALYFSLILLLMIPAVITRLTLGRMAEWRSDNYAIKMGYGKDLASALQKLRNWIKKEMKKYEKNETKLGKVVRRYRELTDEHPEIQERIENALKDKALWIAMASKNVQKVKEFFRTKFFENVGNKEI